MNYGLYLSASGVLTSMYRQDVLANNLANVETVAFKPDMPDVRQRDPASVEEHVAGDVSRQLLDQLGGGVLAGPQRIDFTPGTPRQTNNPLDIAIDGPDNFLVVQAPANGKGQAAAPGSQTRNIRLTRDGRLSVDTQGYLVLAASGQRVLNNSDQPIAVTGHGAASIDAAGRVIQDGEPVGQVQITAVSDKSLLRKEGRSLLTWDGKKDIRQAPVAASVRPNFVETSGADPMKDLVALMRTTNDIENAFNMIHYHDGTMDKAVNTLGRVA